MKQETLPGLDIRETVDGQAVAQKRVSASTPSVVTAVKRSRPDPYIWGIYIMFLLISIVELFSASSTEVSSSNVYSPLIRHGIFLALGLGIVLWLQNTPYILMRRFAWIFAILSLGLLILSTVAGVEINGAQRALRIAGMTIQPAEIVKLSVVLLLASILSKNQTPGGVTNRGIITSAVVVVVFAVFLYKDGLTNTILLMGVSISMFLIGGIQWSKFGMILVTYGVCAILLLLVKNSNKDAAADDFENVKIEAVSKGNSDVAMQTVTGDGGRETTRGNRITRWLEGVHPNDPIDDFNRQVIFSKFAQANGGLVGQGPGNSRESARLPLAFSDYIYSIIVEDTGFIGGSLLLILFLLLVARAGRIAYKCSRAFPAFLIMGCAVMIVFQALVHMAIVTGLFPVSGQPLPFISKGGTSVIVMSAAIGMMLSVSRYAVTTGNKKDIRAELKELPEDMQAANFSNYQNQQ